MFWKSWMSGSRLIWTVRKDYLFKDYVNVGAKLDEALTISEVMYGAGVSDVRMALSNFAKQYIGNPYVWGGTSLTKGADCSGFVLSVFRNYGISLPHSSRAQANCGTKISLSELKPGEPGILWQPFRYQPRGNLCGWRTGCTCQLPTCGHHDLWCKLS